MLTTILFAALSAPAAVAPVAAAPVPTPAVTSEGIAWFEDGLTRALRSAKRNESLVFIAFVPETSAYSQQVVAETFPDERVTAELAELVCLRFDDQADRRFQTASERYNVESFPTFVLATPDGDIEDRIEGFIPADPMIEQLKRIKSGVGTVSWHRAEVAGEPDQLGHVYSLAQMLDAVRDYDEAERTYALIRSEDPRGETAAGARLAMSAVWDALAESSGEDKSEWDLSAVHAHLATVPEGVPAFQGWTSVGNFHAGLEGQLGHAADAFAKAWEHVPAQPKRSWARDVANFLVATGGESLAERHQAFALMLASTAVAEAERERDEYVAENGTSESDDGGDYDSWVATHLSVLVECQRVFGQTEAAVASLQRCTELDPENPEYPERLANLVAQG